MTSTNINLEKFIKTKIVDFGEYTIYTYTVIATDQNGVIKKHYSFDVSDDNTYVNYPELIKKVPRGFSVLYHDDVEICRLEGLEKFDGSCPLDDDNESSLSVFKRQANDIKQWTNVKVEVMEKANGKMAIFKIFNHNDNYYIFGGSKNMHRVVGINDVIESDQLHFQILKQVQQDIKKYRLEDLIDKTIVGEYVDGKHIVYSENPHMVYFVGPMNNVKYLYPVQNTLPTEQQLDDVRKLEHTEGAVIVYTNLDTGVVFRQKHKSIWYVIIRVMREGLRHFNNDTNAGIMISKVSKIIKARSDAFLNLRDEDIIKWNKILTNFVYFVKQSKYSFDEIDSQKHGIGGIFREFTMSNFEHNEPVVDPGTEPEEILQLPELRKYINKLHTNSIKICIIMRGPSGSGKSTEVYKLKELYGDSFVSFSTDNLFTVDGKYRFDRADLKQFHNQNFLNFKEAIHQQVDIVCVDNTNILDHEYTNYTTLAKTNDYITVLLESKKMDPDALLSRTIHDIPKPRLVSMASKYKFASPQYYGVFFKPGTFNAIFEELKYVPKQKTPLHVTIYFGDAIGAIDAIGADIGEEICVNIVSFRRNKIGACFVVNIDKFANSHNDRILHITLETNEGYKPKDTGRGLLDEGDGDGSCINYEINRSVQGIYGPIY